jgi:2-polyprenyl-6-methoxyphenol hydroxylase-like FAD-dependent oxidoreductase
MNYKIKQPTVVRNSAIIIGGSMTGLIVAKVLINYFDKVTIIERDYFPEKPEFRQGVPQSIHAHLFLSRGKKILEQLFPGLIAELIENGALETDVTEDWRYLLAGGWAPSFRSGISMPTCSRNLLENVIRQRLSNCRNLEFLEAHQVIGLVSTENNQCITGVKVKSQQNRELKLSAQLVVDASGRNSQTPKWLESLGYQKPQETVINSFAGYATRWYQKPPKFDAPWKGLAIMHKPQDCKRIGALYPAENRTWILTMAGIGKDYPPTDEDGFLEFARSLRSSEIYEAIKDAQPISPIYSYRRTENRLRHYDKLAKLPENFVVMGDAVCSFNPVYGQGITVAALSSLTLIDCLEKPKFNRTNQSLFGLSQYFQKQIAEINKTPWLMATSDDLRWSTTIGAKPNFKMRFMHGYIEKVTNSACHSKHIYKTLVEVSHMLKPPSALFTPSVLFKVLSYESI